MNDDSLKMCIDCVNKQFDAKLPNGMYYCPFVLDILSDGIVHYDTDATECVEKGFFKDIKSVEDKQV